MASPASLGGETMGTTWRVQLYAPRAFDVRRAHRAIESVFDRVIAQMSTWTHESVLSRFNTAPANTWHALPDEMQRVLQAALAVHAASDGAFDPTVSPLVALWGFGADARLSEALPDAAAVAQARSRVDAKALQLRDGRLWQPGHVRLDLSAIAKGHAVDAVVDALKASGATAALVEVGGELAGFGRKPDGQCWHVQVETPDETETPCVVRLDDGAIASSGDRWQAWQAGDQRVSHTLDPRTGAPADVTLAQVSVMASDAMHADAWSTALLVMGASAGPAYALEHGMAARFLLRTPEGPRDLCTPAFEQHRVTA